MLQICPIDCISLLFDFNLFICFIVIALIIAYIVYIIHSKWSFQALSIFYKSLLILLNSFFFFSREDSTLIDNTTIGNSKGKSTSIYHDDNSDLQHTYRSYLSVNIRVDSTIDNLSYIVYVSREWQDIISNENNSSHGISRNFAIVFIIAINPDFKQQFLWIIGQNRNTKLLTTSSLLQNRTDRIFK